MSASGDPIAMEVEGQRAVTAAQQLEGPSDMPVEGSETAAQESTIVTTPKPIASLPLIIEDEAERITAEAPQHATLQPRILVPSSSPPPREDDSLSGTLPPAQPQAKRRRRAYSIHDETLTADGPLDGSESALVDEGHAIEMAFHAAFEESKQLSMVAGPAFGEASSSKQKILVPDPVRVSQSEVNVKAAPSRTPSPDSSASKLPAGPEPELLSSYVCPICLSPPMNATLTPCGHICCGECLFTAVRSALQRGANQMTREPVLPRCPVCRAILKGWDGKGRGVIGLKPRAMIAL